MVRFRPTVIFLLLALALCLFGLHVSLSQSATLRRVTNTTDEAININPSLSGDGRRIAFESTEDLAHAGGAESFRSIRADIGVDPALFTQLGATRSPAPGISQDGSRLAFASKDDPLGTNPDHNSEIFLFDGQTLRQITNTSPGDPSLRARNGNFSPSLSDDGRYIAFSSNRDLANLNADANFEVFIYDSTAQSFSQLTSTVGIVGSTDAKISGNATQVAYLRDNNINSGGTVRDLMLQARSGGVAPRILKSSVGNLALTYGRAISDDGTRIVYAGDSAPGISQVFIFDTRSNSARQITQLAAPLVSAPDVPLHATISGDGNRIAFATRRSVIGGNTDRSIELYTFDVPTGQFARVTDAPSQADGFSGSSLVTEVVSSLNDDGTLVAFNFPRVLSGPITDSNLVNNSEIYVTATAPRPQFGTITVLNGASFGNEPATTEAVAPDSIAVAQGGALADATIQAARQPDGSFPRNVGGTTVTVNNRAAQIFFVSPTQVNFLVPPETEIGTAEVVVTNPEGFQSRGSIAVLRAAPGIFTYSGDGRGEGVILDANTLQPGPFDPTSGNLRLIIFSTGVRNASQVTVTIAGRATTVESVMASPDMPGLDEVHILVPADLRGAGTVDLVIRADSRDSNPVQLTLTGEARRDIVINEVLADPPDGAAGDANHDGVRSGTDDEFVELVNASGHDMDISGFQLFSRSNTATTDTLRHTFAAGTIFPAGTAIVIFGGGNFDPNDPIFGGALVLKASSGGLSLTNTGGFVTLKEPNGTLVQIFSYGGSTGLNGDSNQSLTRSPDAGDNSPGGSFVLHTTAPNSGGRAFSPGTRVNGTPFAARTIGFIVVSPSSATIDVGGHQQFTARAFDPNSNEIPGVIFNWSSSDTTVATIDQNGLATGIAPGTSQIRASARGVTSGPATLTVNDVQRVLTRIDLTPTSATIPVGGSQQFTAHAFDQNNNEITGVTFTWASSDTNVATVDQNGLATGLSTGATFITASASGVTSNQATLNVVAPTFVINEVLADPAGSAATDLTGDANHDGTRSASDDEFVEFVNSSSGALNLSGWTVRTRATTGTTETLRHTFAANSTLASGAAIVVFGGGNFDPNDPVFGCAQVVRASSGGLSLTNTGLNIIVRDASGNLVAQFAYGGSTGLNGDNDQSLTRSPDISGSFVQHTTAAGAAGRRFSPGLKVDGTPFVNCPGRLTSITISPTSASILVGQTQQFTAQAFDQFGNAMTGVTITFSSDNNTVATVDSVTTDPGTGIATATVTGHAQGIAHITAQATDGTTTVTSSQATLTVNTASPTANLTINDVTQAEGNTGTTTFTFTVSLSAAAPAGGVTFDIATADGTATAASGDYVARSLTGQTIPAGQQTYTFDVTVNGDVAVESNETFFVNVTNVTGANLTDGQGQGTITNDDSPAAGNVVISQLYGGGGNSGATFTNDFIEIFNRGTTAVDLTGWSVQYQSATGTTAWSVTNLSGTLQPGQYYLIQEASNAAVGSPLPTPDASGTIVMAATAGKVALLNATTALSGSCPSSANIIDLVGYGTTATCFEGTGPAPAPSATAADFRAGNGCTDTNNNATDFSTATPAPRNTSSPLNDCSAAPPPNITVNDVAAAEGNSGTKTFTFTVNLSSPAPTGGVTFSIATADGTATVADNDYVARSLTGQTIPAGQQSYSFDVTVNGDTKVEADETFFVNLSSVVGATVTDGQGQGTIQNDDASALPSLTINDVTQAEGNTGTTTFTFTVSLSAAAPAGGVTFDIATADGTATVADNDYVARALTAQTIPAGQQTYTFDVTVNGDVAVEANETFTVNVTNVTNAVVVDGQGQGTITNDDAAAAGNLVISQVYGGGGNSGATYTNDFIEIFNRGTTTVDFAVTPYSVQYAAATSNFGSNVTVINSGSIAPGHYFLVQEFAPSSPAGVALPTPDATGNTNLATSGGKVALVFGTTALSAAPCPGDDGSPPFNPNGNNIVDFVGYGSAASCYEGSGPAPAHANTTADLRKAGGCTDTNDNAADFLVATPFPRNTASPVNNCTAGTAPTLSINDVAQVEGNSGTTTFTFTVSLSAPAPSTDVTFDIATANGTATSGSDYVAKSQINQIIPAGQQTYTFSVTVNGDVTLEPDETFFVNVTNVVGATLGDGQGQGTILNDDLPTLTINDVSQAEGNAGTTTFTFTVSLAAPAPAGGVTFDIATADGTATVADNDYVARALTAQTIPAGQQTYTFDVTVNGDTTIEPNETFFVNVTNVTGATVTDGQGQGTIQNDDSPALSINDVSQAEGDTGTTTFTFTVSLSQPAPAGGVTFDIATADGTATAGSDYVARSLTGQTIPAGQQTYTFDVTVNGDKLVEPNETFNVNLTNVVGATLLDGQGVGTIQNDDAANLVVSQIYQGGGLTSATFTNDFIEIFNRGTTTINFPVTPYSVQFLSTSGSTWAKTDLTSGTIAPGQYFLVQEAGGATGAALPTPDATGSINITSTVPGKVALVVGTTLLAGSCPGDDGVTPFNPLSGTIADFVGYGGTAATANHCYEGSGPAPYTTSNNTIADFRKFSGCQDTNDNAADFQTATPAPRNTSSPANNCSGASLPNLTINDVAQAEGNSGTTTFTFTVSLSAPAPAGGVTFDIATADGTATTANNDYVARSLTTQSIAAGQQTYTFNVTVNGDVAVEPDETFLVNVTNVSNANVVDGQGQGTIQNDDAAPLPTLSINDVSANEGNAGTTIFTFTVTLSAAAPAGGVTFDIATADGTATVADNDYVSRSLTSQTILAGQQTYTFDVTVNGDTKVEPNETFFVNVTNVTNATILDGQGQGTIQNDDAAAGTPQLVISQIYGGGSNAGAAFSNDFVQIFNRGTATVDFSVTPYSVQYASSAGTFSAANKVDLTTGTLAPGQYFLIKLAPASPTTGTTFTADVTNTGINMSATDGKVALVVGTTVATTTAGCPTAVTIADLVGYGGANCSETTATAVLSATKVAVRNNGGCTDTGNNSTDFTVTTVTTSSPVPKNSSAPPSPCP